MEAFFVHKHPVDGEISLGLDGNSVRLNCRWPFDAMTDEWIDLSNTFGLQEYLEAVSNLTAGEPVTIRGISAGGMTVTLMDTGAIRLYMEDARGVRPVAFEHQFDAVPDDLIPAAR